MTQKIIFFDIDGTLLDDEKQLPLSTQESVQKLKDEGYIVAIATGRAPFTFKELREQLDITTYVSLNGQYVVHNNQVVYKNPLDTNALQDLVSFTQEQKQPLVFVNHEDWRSNVEHHPHIEEAIRTLKVEHQVTFDPDSYKTDEHYQALLFCEGEDERLYGDRFQHFDFVRWHNYSVDVLPKGGSKAIGIKRLLDALDLDYKNAYAFGDGLNDREMLEFIPNSVAMGNAVDSVKKIARFTTKNVNEDGIFHGLKMVGLLS